MGKLRKTILLFALAALPLAACGDDDDGGGAIGGGGDEESFCDDARELDDRFQELESSDDFDVDLLREIRDEVSDLDPPDEIQEDFEALIEGFDLFIEEFGDADLTDPAVLERLGELEDDFAAFEESSERVTTFLEEECGISSE